MRRPDRTVRRRTRAAVLTTSLVGTCLATLLTGPAAGAVLLRESAATRFAPPRTLKAPVGLWFSCFTRMSRPVSADRSGCFINGVGLTRRATRGRAGVMIGTVS